MERKNEQMARTTVRRNVGKTGRGAGTKSRSKANVYNAKKNPRVASPLREILAQMTGKRPPAFLKGHYTTETLSEGDTERLQNWAIRNVRPSWLTGIGLMDAADSQVHEAIMNGNIPPAPGETAVISVHWLLIRARLRHDLLLHELAAATEREAREGICQQQ